MAGRDPPKVVKRWTRSGAGRSPRAEARHFQESSQPGTELCGGFTSDDDAFSGHSRTLTPRSAGNLASPRHMQLRSPRGMSPRRPQPPMPSLDRVPGCQASGSGKTSSQEASSEREVLQLSQTDINQRDETFWTDMAEEYCGTEEGHLEAALHAESGDGQEIGLYPQGSAEEDSEADMYSRAAEIFRAAHAALAEQRAAAVDGREAVLGKTDLPATPDQNQSAITDEMLALALDSSMQQLGATTELPQQPPGSCTPPPAAARQRTPDRATPSPDRPCWSPSLGPMLEETVGSLFAATPLENLE
ncbi:hypothetical protein WJX75_002624 [Coccomyxa subellipsoidea]|uniref:Uncharacterized protein n=1 Tax=Coccomyxa subellipsoidea TaxID=248742 RepID=A0ABR2YHM7_9CHLO